MPSRKLLVSTPSVQDRYIKPLFCIACTATATGPPDAVAMSSVSQYLCIRIGESRIGSSVGVTKIGPKTNTTAEVTPCRFPICDGSRKIPLLLSQTYCYVFVRGLWICILRTVETDICMQLSSLLRRFGLHVQALQYALADVKACSDDTLLSIYRGLST